MKLIWLVVLQPFRTSTPDQKYPVVFAKRIFDQYRWWTVGGFGARTSQAVDLTLTKCTSPGNGPGTMACSLVKRDIVRLLKRQPGGLHPLNFSFRVGF